MSSIGIELYTWGANSHGQLGQNSREDALKPIQLKNPTQLFSSSSSSHFTKISIGGGHLLAIFDDNDNNEQLLVGCGWNEEKQLIFNEQNESQSKNEDFLSFQIIQKYKNNSNLSKILSIACGWSHSVILKENGDCFLFGSFSITTTPKQQSQSNLSHKTTKLSFQNQVILNNVNNQPLKIKSIACGLKHSVFVSDQGLCFSMGEGKFCALGHGNNENVFSPKLIESLQNQAISEVVCGSKHTLFISSDRFSLFGCGDDKYSQLGLSQQRISIPTKIVIPNQSSKRISKVDCGWNNTLISFEKDEKTKQSQIFGIGRNEFGQLGLGHNKSPIREWTSLKSFETKYQLIDFACGSEHTIALAKRTIDSTENANQSKQEVGNKDNNENEKCVLLLVFGWAEHGQLGLETTEDKYEPTLLMKFEENKHLRIFAGGANSILQVLNQ